VAEQTGQAVNVIENWIEANLNIDLGNNQEPEKRPEPNPSPEFLPQPIPKPEPRDEDEACPTDAPPGSTVSFDSAREMEDIMCNWQYPIFVEC